MSVVVVTGASSGIGRAISLAFARRGDAVGLVARRRDRLDEVAAEIAAAGGRALVSPADVAARAEAEAAIAAVRERLGPIDLLVNNAGMPGGSPFARTDVEEVERVMRVNYLGAVYATKAVLDEMVARRSGSIVAVASVAGRIGVPRAGAYSATKFALVGFFEALSLELSGIGIEVAIVNPGPVRTESFPHRILRRRFLRTPEQVARAVVRAVERRRPQVTIPSYFAAVHVLSVLAPPAYRAVLRRFAAMTGDERLG